MEINFSITLSLGFILCVAFFIDIRRRIIPNALTFPAMISGWTYHAIEHGLKAGVTAIGASMLALSLLGLLYLLRAVGAGDVKLFMAFAAWTGIHWMLLTLIGSILLCGALGSIIVIGRKFYSPWYKLKQLPMMYAVFPVAWYTLITG